MKPFHLVVVRSTVAVCAAILIAGCAPLRVQSFTERGVDFSRYRSYDWGVTGTWTGDPRLDSNPFFHGYVRSAVETQLLTKGIERLSYGRADLLVYYYASSRQQLYVRGEDEPYAACVQCGLDVYDEDTLLLDFVDARTDRLLWRGWAAGSIEGVVDDQAAMERRIDEAVARILEKLPAAGKSPI